MELEMMYPEIIVYSLIASFVVLLVWRRKKKFKKGVMVANSKYIKQTSYYKRMLFKYHFYNFLIKTVCILLIFICAVITSRINKIDTHNEEFYNRDIMLCMDVSGSMASLNKAIFSVMKDTIADFKDERFSIVFFDSSSVVVLPFTTDYNYAINVLDDLIGAYEDGYYGGKYQYISAGTTIGGGSSLIGDGLAYCSSSFKKDEDRSKIVILTTDNYSGRGIVTLDEAANYSKANNVKVFPIGIAGISGEQKAGLVSTAATTGGIFYDFSSYSTADLKEHIDKINKTSMIKNAYTTREDLPELLFSYLLFIIPILFLLEWRVRI